MQRFLLASTLLTLACGSKGASDGALDLSADTPGDAPPTPLHTLPDGLAKQPIHDKMVVFDTIGGFQIHYPGNPEIDDGIFYAHRDAVASATTVINPRDPGLIGFVVDRLPHRPYDAAATKAALDDGVALLRTAGDQLIEDRDVIVAGHPARKLAAQGTVDGTATRTDAWIVLVGERDTLYTIVGRSHGSPDPMLAKVAMTFHRSP